MPKTTTDETPKRTRRSTEERIAELQERIKAIRLREEARAAVQAEHVKQARLAAAGLARASRAAEEAGDRSLHALLDGAEKDLRELLAERGVRTRGAA